MAEVEDYLKERGRAADGLRSSAEQLDHSQGVRDRLLAREAAREADEGFRSE